MVKNLDWHFLRHKPFRPATLLRRDSKNIGKMLRTTLFLQNTSGGCFWRQSNAQLVNVISWITYECIEYTVMNDWNGSVNNKIKHFKGQYTYDVHENSLLFKTPHPPCPSMSIYIQNCSNLLDLGRPISNEPPIQIEHAFYCSI